MKIGSATFGAGLALFALPTLCSASNTTVCRCTFGNACWPSSAEFAQLASQVSQPLIHPIPPASPCYTSSTSADCLTVQNNQFNGTWRAENPGSMQFPNNERFTFPNGTISACYVNSTLGFPCEQGSTPVIGVDARSVEDIQAAVKFAVQQNLRLTVKNTGHDYLGRSTGRGSFVIWTHNLKKITYSTSFTPENAPASERHNAITVSAGDQWHDAYATADAHGQFMVGGVAAGGSVGAAGGWFGGGGYSLVSSHYGLGIDSALEATVVTSTGEHLTANLYTNPDLFWALRGGGAGTYGVVTSVTYQTYPRVPVIAAFFIANMNTQAVAETLVNEHIRVIPSLVDSGWNGHGIIAGEQIQIFYLNVNVSWAEANSTIDPFFNFAQNLTSRHGLDIQSAYTTPFGSFYDWYLALYGTDGDDGQSTEIASRLLTREVVENYEPLGNAFLEGNVNWILAGGEISKVDQDAMGVNPAWRTALVHAVVGTSWEEGTPTDEINLIIDDLLQSLEPIKALAPNSGCYMNEASLFEPDPEQTFFGSHYDRLRAIKAVYDPFDIFVVTEGVGSNEWDKDLICRV